MPQPSQADPVQSSGGHFPLSGEFHTAMIHFYRGEMNRLTVWRTRLDATSHWAILLTTGMVTFTLGTPGVPHYIVLLGLALNAICLVIEGRRYQHLHHSKWRVGLLEHNYFAQLLCAAGPICEPTWRRQLAAELEHPHFTISLFLATRLRLRRNYLMLLFFITAVWLTKVYIHPYSPAHLSEYYARLAVGELIPSWLVAITAGVFVFGSAALALWTPSEEELERWTKLRRSEQVRTAITLDGRVPGNAAPPPGSAAPPPGSAGPAAEDEPPGQG